MRRLANALLFLAACSTQSQPRPDPPSEPPAPAPSPMEKAVADSKNDHRFSATVDLSKPGPDATLILWHKQTDVGKVLGTPEVSSNERERYFIDNEPGEGDDVEIDVDYKGHRAWKMAVIMTDAAARLAEIQHWVGLPKGKEFHIGRELYRARADGALSVVFVHLVAEDVAPEDVFPDDSDRFMTQ